MPGAYANGRIARVPKPCACLAYGIEVELQALIRRTGRRRGGTLVNLLYVGNLVNVCYLIVIKLT
jgi:hypothetical protein